MPEHKQYSLSEAMRLPAEEVISYKLKHESFTRPFYYARTGWSPTFAYKVNTKYPETVFNVIKYIPKYTEAMQPLAIIVYNVLEANLRGMSRNGFYGWH